MPATLPSGIAFPATATIIPGLGPWNHDPDLNSNSIAGRHCPEGCEQRWLIGSSATDGETETERGELLVQGHPANKCQNPSLTIELCIPPMPSAVGFPLFPAERVGAQTVSQESHESPPGKEGGERAGGPAVSWGCLRVSCPLLPRQPPDPLTDGYHPWPYLHP